MAVTWDGYGSMGTGTFQTWLTLSTRKEGWAEEHLKAALVTLGDLHLPCLTHWGLLVSGAQQREARVWPAVVWSLLTWKKLQWQHLGQSIRQRQVGKQDPCLFCHKAMGANAGKQQVVVSVPQVGRVQVPTRRSRPSFLGPGRESGLE